MLNDALSFLDKDAPNALKRLLEVLSIPSVSTDPAYAPDVVNAATWTAKALRDAGLETQIHETDGHPIVLGHTPGAPGSTDKPRVLFYGHYDVQPPDPLDGWTSPPFSPQVRNGAVFARGASDDKGQVCCFIEALRAWKHANGGPPLPVTVLIEGEEECGSVQLGPFLEAHRDELAADIAIVSDTIMWETPTGPRYAITYGLRGLLYFDLQLHHASRDLHSGMYGGTLANPANILTAILGRLFDDRHRVTVAGFYEDVLDVDPGERTQWDELAFDDKAFLAAIGVSQPHGESGFDTIARRWARPSCDINGLYGGYGGAGAKTVIPTMAGAKVSFRLAPNQNPAKIAAAFRDWLTAQDTHGCRWQITEHGQAEPVVVPADSAFVQAASRAIQLAAGHTPVMIREGATIPVVADFKCKLGLNTLLIGLGRADDCIHSPDEKLELECFTQGCRVHAAVLAELAKIG